MDPLHSIIIYKSAPQDSVAQTKTEKCSKRSSNKKVFTTPMTVKKYGTYEVLIAADGTHYMILPTGQWIRVVK